MALAVLVREKEVSTHSLVESLQAMWHRYRCQLHHPRGGVSATRLSRATPPPTNPTNVTSRNDIDIGPARSTE